MQRVATFFLCASFAIGCAAPGVERGAITTPDVASLGPVTIVMAPMVRPPDLTGDAASARRLRALETHLDALYARVTDHVETQAEPGGAFQVSYRVRAYRQHSEGPEARFWGAIVIGGLTAGLGLLLAIDTHEPAQHEIDFEVSVLDVRRASIVDGAYDPRVSVALMHRTYTGGMRTWTAPGTSGPSGAQLDAFMDEEGAELARTMFALSVDDVTDAIRSAAPIAAPSVSTSGGESP